MKITCPCGNIIYDQTDAISYKASFVADQDSFELSDALKRHIRALGATLARTPADIDSAIDRTLFDVHNAIRTYSRRTMYQCSACGRLFVDDAHYAPHVFVPAETDAPRNLLRSKDGERWKRPLRGRWNDRAVGPNKGELWWGFGDADEGYEQFDDLDALQRRYYEVFERLHARDILRDALLTRGDDTLHQWSHDPAL